MTAAGAALRRGPPPGPVHGTLQRRAALLGSRRLPARFSLPGPEQPGRRRNRPTGLVLGCWGCPVTPRCLRKEVGPLPAGSACPTGLGDCAVCMVCLLSAGCVHPGGFPSCMHSPSAPLQPPPCPPPPSPGPPCAPDVLRPWGIPHLSPRWCCPSKARCPAAPGTRSGWPRGCWPQHSAPRETTCGLLALFSAASTQAWSASPEVCCLGSSGSSALLGPAQSLCSLPGSGGAFLGSLGPAGL